MPRGGKRQGQPGQAYPNRTDMAQAPRAQVQAPRATPGQTYGQAGQQIAAQQAVPLPLNTVPLDAPTQRPQEPITAGMPFGPGPGPEALGVGGSGPGMDLGAKLRALYSIAPNEDLARLIAQFDTGARG